MGFGSILGDADGGDLMIQAEGCAGVLRAGNRTLQATCLANSFFSWISLSLSFSCLSLSHSYRQTNQNTPGLILPRTNKPSSCSAVKQTLARVRYINSKRSIQDQLSVETSICGSRICQMQTLTPTHTCIHTHTQNNTHKHKRANIHSMYPQTCSNKCTQTVWHIVSKIPMFTNIYMYICV